MDENAVLDEFRAAGALLEGHFVLSSGRHSPAYLQCARVTMDARRGERLCAALADRLRERFPEGFDLVVSPAMGGVIVGYEVGRQLGVPAIFMERVEGSFALRRGFGIEPGARCLMMEDVVTTGLSSRECIAAIGAAGGNCTAAACLVDRSGGTADVGVPLVSLATIEVPSYLDADVPAELAAIPITKPGSRFLR
ncbi:orotate phosphoribosyltransferase [Microbaculum marinum]|uniref:Orotate phosphoribosyltransferase n=1 Tax=Microbaculum marinum TaxID=1764581 RepID=A0AAW9RP04_9HYPH